MAEKTVVVRLVALAEQYQREMAKSKAATDGLAKAGVSLEKLGPQLSQLGDTMTRRVTLPIIGAGVAAGALAVNFDETFRRMVGLAGIAASEVDGLKDSVLDLAGETGRAPQDLADGLYFIASAGIDASVRMDALKVSARGATAGLGDTAVVADAVTSAIGAYGKEAITAAEAGDVLAASAREGKAEASALAPQFGRLLPIASELGVEFHEVGASLAFLSRSGGGAELAATNLQNVLQKLLTPAEEGRAALEQIGITTDDLRRSIKDRGLLDTLLFLRESLEANGLELGDFSRDAQFTTGVLALTRNEGEAAREVFDALADSSGSLGEAFDAAAQGPGFEMRQAFAELQAAAITAGDIVIPIAADIAGFIARIGETFAGLPSPAQVGLLALLGVAAAAGPILKLVGNISKLRTALEGLGAAGATASKGLGFAAKVGVITGLVIALREALTPLREALSELPTTELPQLTNSLLDFAETGRPAGEVARFLGEDLGKLGDAVNAIADTSTFDEIGNAMESLTTRFGGNTDLEQARERIEQLDQALSDLASQDPEAAATAFDTLSDALERQGVPAERLLEIMPQYRGVLADLDTAQRTAGDSASGMADGLDELPPAMQAAAEAAERAAEAVEELGNRLRAQFDPLFGMIDAINANRDAQVAYADAVRAVSEAQAALDQAIAEHGPTSEEAAEATRDLEQANRDLTDAQTDTAETALNVQGAAIDLAAAVRNGSVSVEDARRTLQGWVQQGLITEEQASAVAGQFDAAATAAENYQGEYVAEAVAHTSEAERILNELARDRTVHYFAVFHDRDVAVEQQTRGGRRWGGIDLYMQAGGITQAHIARRPRVRYAEPATGGEAFIPKKGDSARSLSILDTAASWYGAQVVPAGMGAMGGGVMAVGGNTYYVDVRVEAGADLARAGRHIAEALSAYERRSGAGWRGN